MILKLSDSSSVFNREKFVQFCTRNFNTFHYLSLIDNQYVDQFFIANNNAKNNSKGTFGALSTIFNLSLVETSETEAQRIEAFFEPGEEEQTGLVVFQPQKNNRGVVQENQTRAFATQRIIEVTGRGVVGSCRALIWSAIAKNKPNWKVRLSLLAMIITLAGIIGTIIKVSLKKQDLYGKFGTTGMNLPFYLAVILFGILFLAGLVTLFIFSVIKKQTLKQESNYSSYPEQQKSQLQLQKEQHKKDQAKLSFVIIVKGTNREEVELSCQQIKTSIEALLQDQKITGKIILKKKGFLEQIYRLFGWNIKNVRKAFEKKTLFKETKIPIQLASTFFSLKTNLPSSSREIENYQYEIGRTERGTWFIGEQYFSPQIQAPLYLHPSNLNQQALICGPTGRGKSYFILKLLACLRKHNPEIHFLLFDLKGEYVRFFGGDHSTLIIIPGSKEAPLGLNIFQIDKREIDSNKRFVKNLLGDFLECSIQQPELSPFMEDCVNNAIDKTFALPFRKRNLQSFIQMIDAVLDQHKKEGVPWAESTKVALNARFRELFSGWFKRVFGVDQSNFNSNILKQYNVIIKMDHLLRDNDLNTVKLITNSIMNLLSRDSKELHDAHSKTPWLLCIFEEAQKIVPRIQKRDSSKLTAIESFMEIARAYGVSSIAVGQNPNLISERFLQAGFIADFGTESRVLDNIIFTGEEDPSAIASKEKERLRKPGMCFLKLSGEPRILLKVNRFQPKKILPVEQIKELIIREPRYALLKEQYNSKIISDSKIGEKEEKNQTFKHLNI